MKRQYTHLLACFLTSLALLAMPVQAEQLYTVDGQRVRDGANIVHRLDTLMLIGRPDHTGGGAVGVHDLATGQHLYDIDTPTGSFCFGAQIESLNTQGQSSIVVIADPCAGRFQGVIRAYPVSDFLAGVRRPTIIFQRQGTESDVTSRGSELGSQMLNIGDLDGDQIDELAISAPGEDHAGTEDKGAVYVVNQQLLDMPNSPTFGPSEDSFYGASLAHTRLSSSQPVLAIGAPGENRLAGAVLLVDPQSGQLLQTLNAQAGRVELFGVSLGFAQHSGSSEKELMVGRSYGGPQQDGQVDIYTLSSSNPVSYVHASTLQPNSPQEAMGERLAVSSETAGDILTVASPNANWGATQQAGLVRHFALDGNGSERLVELAVGEGDYHYMGTTLESLDISGQLPVIANGALLSSRAVNARTQDSRDYVTVMGLRSNRQILAPINLGGHCQQSMATVAGLSATTPSLQQGYMEVSISGAVGTMATLLVSLERQGQPFSIPGMQGTCSSPLMPDLAASIANVPVDSSGSAQFLQVNNHAIPIGSDPALEGFSFVIQALIFNQSGALIQISDALRVTIGQ